MTGWTTQRWLEGLVLAGLMACKPAPPELIGTARLPDCTDPPAADLSGTWFDQGTVTITSTGCEDYGAEDGEMFDSCPLNWVTTQTGNDVRFVVDDEYEVRGRLCGTTLHLEGGWWLPVENELGQCNYDDDDGDEVGIETGGASLELGDDGLLTGVLSVQGQCSASYDVFLTPM